MQSLLCDKKSLISFKTNRLHSGITVYVKQEEYKEKLKKYFRNVRANKLLCSKYTVLLIGSLPAEGCEDFPLELIEFGNILLVHWETY